MISPPDAWVLAKILSGLPVNVEVEALAAPLRPIGVSLVALPPADRRTVWGGFLAGREDRDQLTLAIAGVDPEGPQPEPTDEDTESDWKPIRLGSIPDAVAFPIEVLPLEAREMVEAVAASVSCPVDFPAVAVLAAASALIGRSVSILVKPGYFESSLLWLALVGTPSAGKTPAISQIFAVVRAIAGELYLGWKTELDRWKANPDSTPADKPVLPRISTSDATTEALAPILAANPRGLIVACDELTKLIMSMDQYKGGRGGDKPFYLSAWSGQPVTVDRVRHAGEPIMVPHPALAIVGGLVPDMLGELVGGRGREDGFSARFLFAHPDRSPRPYTEEGVAEATADAWAAIARNLWARPMRDLNGEPAPHIATMTSEGRVEWVRQCRAHRAEMDSDDFPASMDGCWGKLEAYAARLALVLACLNHASDPTVDPAAVPRVDGLTVHDAWRLIEYFKAGARRVHAGGSHDVPDDVQTLLGWIDRGKIKEFSLRDVGKNLRRFRQDQAALEDALGWMVVRNLIRPKTEPTAEKPKAGRKRSLAYEVHPLLSARRRNGQNTQIKEATSGFDDSVHSDDDVEESK
jgi:hypothetical protein